MSRVHIVRAGDCLSSIAAEHGFASWEEIYNHTDNSDLRELRPDPELLVAGDVVHLPDEEEKSETIATGSRHRFRVSRPEIMLRLALVDEEGQALANKDYSLEVDGRTITGTTDGDGNLEEPIDAQARAGQLQVFAAEDGSATGYTWTLELGMLDPVDAPAGVLARLSNLGFDCDYDSVADGDLPADGAEAIRAFQEREGLEVTGVADDATKQKLVELHDGE